MEEVGWLQSLIINFCLTNYDIGGTRVNHFGLPGSRKFYTLEYSILYVYNFKKCFKKVHNHKKVVKILHMFQMLFQCIG